MNTSSLKPAAALPRETAAFYRRAMSVLREAGVPFLVGGAYAFACYTGITRHTKDFDLFIRQRDLARALEAFQEAGYEVEVTFPHWLAKVYANGDAIDLIFRSGNGISEVDDAWFTRAEEEDVLGDRTRLCPPEEIIWTKAFVMERERYDGADIAHLLRSRAADIDWDRLLHLFGSHWRILFSHLILFGFIYPSERHRIPQPVMQRLMQRLQKEMQHPAPEEPVCQGTLISRAQYLVDIECWGYKDARRQPYGGMTAKEVADWTAAIEDDDVPHPKTDQR